jgi:CrcB protein
MNVMTLAVAGAVGTLLRYALATWIGRATGDGFPWGTCAVNILGCLAIGALAAWADRGGALPPALRIALVVGLLGGFTTFSAFGLETFRLLERAEWGRAMAYVGLTNLAGFAAVWAGYRALPFLR